jgi:hypothetical protein
MIPAYKENWKAYGMDNDDYIAQTTRANTKQGVIDYINEYMQRNDCASDVVELLNAVLANDELLDKTHVVWDGSYRTCVILVRPDGCLSHHGETNLQLYIDNAETLFLNMTDETWEESDIRWFYDAYYDCEDEYAHDETDVLI